MIAINVQRRTTVALSSAAAVRPLFYDESVSKWASLIGGWNPISDANPRLTRSSPWIPFANGVPVKQLVTTGLVVLAELMTVPQRIQAGRRGLIRRDTVRIQYNQKKTQGQNKNAIKLQLPHLLFSIGFVLPPLLVFGLNACSSRCCLLPPISLVL